jgi:dTDP-4-dehydrorhamnose reductase
VRPATDRIVVTGGYGTLAKALRTHFPDAVYLSHEELDVRNHTSVARVVDVLRPTLVIHAAAITDHQCPDLDLLVKTNIGGTRKVAAAAKLAGAKLVYLSTHYVYPGHKGHHTETDRPQPIGHYAWTKLAGEHFALLAPDTLVIRGSWYTRAKVMHWQPAFCDAWTNRTTVEFAAAQIAALITRGAEGIFNIGGPRSTFYDIAVSYGRTPSPGLRTSWAGPYEFPHDSSVAIDKFRVFTTK